MQIKHNLQKVRKKISQIQTKYHLENNIKLVAVSKTKSYLNIKEAFENNQKVFGENYLKEALEKIQKLKDLPIEWHFIGNIQSNKCQQIVENFAWIHSVTKLKTAQKLNQFAKKKTNICLQVNISKEDTKGGCNPNETLDLALKIKHLPNLQLRGLMAIPKFHSNINEQLNECLKLKKIFDELNLKGLNLDTLSMGMSNDLEAAIVAGSNLVRIGTDIFGKRNIKELENE